MTVKDGELLDRLRSHYKTDNVLITGSGTTALYLIARQLLSDNVVVFLPSNICPNVGVTFSQYRHVILIPPDERTLNMDLNELERHLDASRLNIVVAVNSYGIPIDKKFLDDFRNNYQLFVIEDACQSFGVLLNGEVIGSRFDSGVVSFGYGKHIPYKAGGALIVKDNNQFKELTGLLYRENCLRDFVLSRTSRWLTLLAQYRMLDYLGKQTNVLNYNISSRQKNEIVKSWDKFIHNVQQLIEIHRSFYRILSMMPSVQLWNQNIDGWIPWRFSFLIKDRAAYKEFIDQLDEKGLRYSRLYRNLTEYFPDFKMESEYLGRVSNFERSIINLIYPYDLKGAERYVMWLEGIVLENVGKN